MSPGPEGAESLPDAAIRMAAPERYEIYETARDWRAWLAKQYPVVVHQADGHALSQTEDNSVDLVQAHGVFIYLPFLNSVEYFREIARVPRPGGLAAFDTGRSSEHNQPRMGRP